MIFFVFFYSQAPTRRDMEKFEAIFLGWAARRRFVVIFHTRNERRKRRQSSSGDCKQAVKLLLASINGENNDLKSIS